MVNKVTLVGYIGKDPDIKYTASSKMVANASLATSEVWYDDSHNKKEATEWHRLVAWEKVAEVFDNYICKGSLVYVEGKLKTRSWDDKEGIKRYVTEIVCSRVWKLDKSQNGRQNGEHAEPASQPQAAEVQDASEDDKLPF